MKITKWLMGAAVALGIGFVTPASAGHNPLIVELDKVVLLSGSFCASEGTVVSVLGELAASGMAKSVEVYEIYLDMGECTNMRGVIGKIVRVVARFEKAAALEILLKNGKTVYMIVADVQISGEPV